MTDQVWTVQAALEFCCGFLGERDDEHPRLSAEWLLSAATCLSRVELYAFHDRPLAADELANLRDALRRRAAGEPLQYVTGEVAFRHLVLKVRPGVLIPRPETEVVVDVALAHLAGLESPLVADPCTGSGAIALSIAQERPTARVWATDLSPLAVEVATANAEALGLAGRVEVVAGDLLAPFNSRPDPLPALDAVVSNPPYVPSADLRSLPAEVADFEPALALDGGADGLEIFRRLAVQAVGMLAQHGVLVVELDESRVRLAGDEALAWYESVEVVRDLAGRDRVLAAWGPKRP